MKKAHHLVHKKPPNPTEDICNPLMPSWLERSLGALYEIYFKLLKVQGTIKTDSSVSNSGSDSVSSPNKLEAALHSVMPSQEIIDFRATRVGAAYRGIGILVGILGAAIILCALLPVGLSLSSASGIIVGASKVVLMVALVVILFIIRKLKMKERWVELRRAAEHNRYTQLRMLIAAAELALSDKSIEALKVEVARHIGGGGDCQISYNEKKRIDYEGIEAFSTRLTYAAFSLSFAGAAAHLVFHASWLIFLTAYVPALVGAMHAVNSFLRLPQLIEQHGEMVLLLGSLREQFPLDTSSTDSRDKFVSLSRQVLERLENADDSWLGIASHQNLHPV